VKPRARHGHPHQYSGLFRQLCGYAAAAVLPWGSIVLSLRVDALRGTPTALSLASVVCIAILGGNGPGIVSALLTGLALNHLVLATVHFFAYSPVDIIHTVVIVAVGLLIASLSERQRVTGKRLRAALASLEARTDALVQAQQGSNSAAWMYSTRDRSLRWAEGGAQVFGRRFSEMDLPDSAMQFILEEDRERLLRTVQSGIAAGGSFQVDFRVRWPSGEVHWLESRGTVSPFNPDLWHGVTVDITERKNAEIALVRSEKLAAIGRLSATIAHEVNNPLEAVTNLLFLAMAEPDVPARSRDYLTRADQELSRLATIARRTLSFVRPRTSAGPARLNEIVENVVEMFRPRSISRGGEIRIIRDSDLMLPMSADDLRQILTNLVSNACDALPDAGGLIEIETCPRGDGAVSISIRDNGSGILPEDRPRVFDAFFTTKIDVGTGIGLWVTRDLVEKNGGRIYLETKEIPPGFRTVFRIDFPAPREIPRTTL
jgi:signal transduction histidine kinase